MFGLYFADLSADTASMVIGFWRDDRTLKISSLMNCYEK